MSSIKGGGRAKLSEENQNAIIDLLRDLRDVKDPLLPRKRVRGEGAEISGDEEKALSDHDLKKERRRFVKKLVERHERVALSKRLNAASAGSAAAAPQDVSLADQLAQSDNMSEQMQSLNLDAKADASQAGSGDLSDKVRIILAEAVFSSDKGGKTSTKDKKKAKDKDRKSKDEKEKKKSKKDKSSSHPWKEGSTRKPMVLKRSAPVKELLKQAKSKLNMKKKAVRCFYVDGKSKMEIDLEINLAGLEDGAVVYVTSHVVDTSIDVSKKGEDECKDDKAEQDDEANANDVPDPLEPVKRAYAERKMRRVRRRNHRRKKGGGKDGQSAKGSSAEHPVFADHLDKLEELPSARAELPAASYRTKILSALDSSRVVVICGATGCGKSTQIPQTILEGMSAAGRGDDTHIIVTQPRRVAAMSLAERVASERNSPLPGSDGSVVGYSVRLARRVSDDAKIVYCTVGILLRMLVNPSEIDETELCPSNEQNGVTDSKDSATAAIPLSHVSHLVIDEVHERDLNTDFALTLLRSILARNKHIRIVLMSATANPDLFVQYFRSAALAIDPIVLSIPGRTFPVTNNWLSDCEKVAGARLQGWSSTVDNGSVGPRRGIEGGENVDETPVELSPRATSRIDNSFICELIGAIVRKQKASGELSQSDSAGKRTNGAILVFLPGKGEIEALARVLSDDSMVGDGKSCNILKLHSTVPPAQQRFVFQRAKEGTVKIVLTTNVAETSVTVPDASSIIDTGRVKESRFNSSTRIKELVTVWTSRASATQRAGRAGRTGPGVCWKLYTEQFCHEHMPMRTSPEIVRTPLDELVLQCCLLEENMPRRPGESGTRPIKFLRQAPEPPPTKSLLDACDHLLEVGGLEVVASREPELVFKLTPLGFHLSHLPTDAKVAKCLITGCVLECVEPSLTIAACLSHSKSIWLPSRAIDKEGREMQKKLVEEGFGGKDWRGGTVKGDLIGSVAAYNKWSSQSKEKDRRKIASKYALDNNVLREVHSLRSQFRDSLVDAGFLDAKSDSWDGCHDDALFTSCCLVAGLYPNISTLMRPRRGRGNARGGRLITKNGDVCKSSSSSFQADRLWNAKEEGQDAYAVYHAKHRTVGVDTKPASSAGQADIYLNEVNFVSRYALLLFSGNVELKDTAIIMDGWLKFKVGEKGSKAGAILILELRKELDNVITRHIESSGGSDEAGGEAMRAECQRVLQIVRKLLQDEAG